MVYAKPMSHIPWEDQFRRPSLDALRSHYNHQLGQLVQTARTKLLSFDEISEDLQWMGLPWRWTLVYRDSQDPAKSWAYLIPHREKPIIATTLTVDMMNALPMSQLRKFIREGLDTSRHIAGIHWVAWEVTNKTHLDLVLDLLKRKHQFVLAQN